jgi:hypothetical protein
VKAYRPPVGDEPLDDVEQALVRALVPIITRNIREEAAAPRDQPQDDQRPQGAA